MMEDQQALKTLKPQSILLPIIMAIGLVALMVWRDDQSPSAAPATRAPVDRHASNAAHKTTDQTARRAFTAP